jgi:two-component system chemotaxis response regulator CheB
VSDTWRNEAIEVVAIVGSQGALPIARGLVAALPDDFPAAVVYVQHRAPGRPSFLTKLLGRDTRMPVHELCDGEDVRPGVVYVAPAGGQAMVAADRTWRLVEGRCLADPLFTSLAEVYGPAAAGVVLSGRLNDGAAGLQAIKWAGGRGLIQAPKTAEADGMPLAAMATGCYDYVLAPASLAAALVALVTVPGAAALLGVRAHPVAVAGVY